MRSDKKKLGNRKYADTFELYKKRSREYEKQNLEFIKILKVYAQTWDEGMLAKAAIAAFESIINDPPEYEKEYKDKYFVDINKKLDKVIL